MTNLTHVFFVCIFFKEAASWLFRLGDCIGSVQFNNAEEGKEKSMSGESVGRRRPRKIEPVTQIL